MPARLAVLGQIYACRVSVAVQFCPLYGAVEVAHLANVPLSGRPFRAENGAVAVR